jgi:glycosyltransferase involved in cell wall biosynthesis
MLRTQASLRVNKAQRQFVFISNAVDNTGAPQVVTDAVEEFARRHGSRRVRLLAPYVAPDQVRRLQVLGVRIDGALVSGSNLVRLHLGLRPNDFVLMNTVAIREDYRDFILGSLETRQLEHAFWFIHEDHVQLGKVAPSFLNARFLRQVRKLIADLRLTVLVPSKRMRRDYERLLETDGIKTVPLRIDIEERYRRERATDEYRVVNFLISGTPFDGRKGQLIAVAAFNEFLETSYRWNPEAYRDFSLRLVGIGNDYVSQQIRSIGESVLGKRLAILPSVSRQQALEIASGCNAVICCSLNEAFCLYVAEGMAMGHVVLRNESGGVDEQLAEGINGFRIDSSDIKQVAAVLETVLNRTTTSDGELQKMGRASQEIIAPFRHYAYAAPLEELEIRSPREP